MSHFRTLFKRDLQSMEHEHFSILFFLDMLPHTIISQNSLLWCHTLELYFRGIYSQWSMNIFCYLVLSGHRPTYPIISQIQFLWHLLESTNEVRQREKPWVTSAYYWISRTKYFAFVCEAKENLKLHQESVRGGSFHVAFSFGHTHCRPSGN